MHVFIGLLIAAVVIFLYFIPWITATVRHAPNTGSIFVINLFLGLTVIGWIVALAMAVKEIPAAQGLPAPPS